MWFRKKRAKCNKNIKREEADHRPIRPDPIIEYQGKRYKIVEVNAFKSYARVYGVTMSQMDMYADEAWILRRELENDGVLKRGGEERPDKGTTDVIFKVLALKEVE